MANKPTPRQLSYLRSLAERTGQTFTYPHTFAEAGREIDRLKAIRPESRVERRIERKEIADQLATGPVDSARVREDEISGRRQLGHLGAQPPARRPSRARTGRRPSAAPRSSASAPSWPATPSPRASGSCTASAWTAWSG